MIRNLLFFPLALAVTVQAWAQPSGQAVTNANAVETISSIDLPDPVKDKELLQAGRINFVESDLSQVLQSYQEISGRSIIRAASVPAVKLTFTNRAPLNRREALQALDTVLAQSGITMIPLGGKYAKAVLATQAPLEAAPLVDLPRAQLPESSTYMLYIVRLKAGLAPNDLVPVLQPFTKMANSIITIPDAGLLLLRDYSTNIRSMLLVLERMEAITEK